MRIHSYPTLQIALVALATSSCVPSQRLGAQRQDFPPAARVADSSGAEVELGAAPVVRTFSSRADSLAWARAKAVTAAAKGLHIAISLKDKQLWAIDGQDTLLNVPVAVAKGETLQIQGRVWTFTMPRGVRTVRGKEADPIWVPPDWLYAETAVEHGFRLATIRGSVALTGGRRIVVRDSLVGLIEPGQEWAPLPVDEHIVFDGKLFIPPAGTINRRIEGQLGKYRLDLGEGFLLHGTPYQSSIGTAATHGCVRLRDHDILWLYEHVPVGTRVYIY